MSSKNIQIKIADTAGFCPGVKKAIDTVLELSKHTSKHIYTYGPLIHNKQVIDTLKEKRIDAINGVEDLEGKGKDYIVVIRAHGINPEDETRLKGLGVELVDATCPLVKRAQDIISLYAGRGYATIIVGDKEHAEVVGLLGYSRGRGIVVSSAEEAAALPDMEKANIVSQTTQEPQVFEAAVEAARKHVAELVVSNTICHPTVMRQKETLENARDADLVIVVGGKHSANTARLRQICGRLAKQAVHIEREDELNGFNFKGVKKIFITAGTSTPTWMIEKVFEKVKRLTDTSRVSKIRRYASFLWRVAVTSSFITALSAMALTYVCMKLEKAPVKILPMVISWLFAFSLHSIYRAEEKGSAYADMTRDFLFKRHRLASCFISYTSGAVAVLLSFAFGWEIFLLALVFWLLGSMFQFKLPSPAFINFKNLPASKDITTALGWTFFCAFLPAMTVGPDLLFSRSFRLSAVFAFLLVFSRSVMVGVSNVLNDMIVGEENFYKWAGPKITYCVLFGIMIMLMVTLFMLRAMGWQPGLVGRLLWGMSFYFILPVAVLFSRKVPDRMVLEPLIEAQAIILALIACTA